MSFKPFTLFLVFIALLGLLLPQWFFCSKVTVVNENTKFELYYSQGNFSKHRFDKVLMSVFEDEGLKTWQIESEAATNNVGRVWSFDGIDGFYEAKEGNSIIFSGDFGHFNLDLERLKLNENVKVFSSLGYSFNTEVLDVKKEEGGVSFGSEEKVILFDDLDQFRVKALGFRGNVNSGVVDLLSEVWSKKKNEKGVEVIIASDKAKIQSSLSTIKFYENLRVSQDKFKIRGEEADFYVDEETSEIQSIRVRGNIFATDGVKSALSDNVDLKLKQDAIIFQGSPRIWVGDDEMIGEEILITDHQKNIQVIRGSIKSTGNSLKEIEKNEAEAEENEWKRRLKRAEESEAEESEAEESEAEENE